MLARNRLSVARVVAVRTAHMRTSRAEGRTPPIPHLPNEIAEERVPARVTAERPLPARRARRAMHIVCPAGVELAAAARNRSASFYPYVVPYFTFHATCPTVDINFFSDATWFMCNVMVDPATGIQQLQSPP